MKEKLKHNTHAIKMANNTLFGLVISFAVLAGILLLIQIFVGARGKKRLSNGTTNTDGNYYQIIPFEDVSKRLTNAVGTPDESINYSFTLSSPDNAAVHILKISGKDNDVNTWWRFVRDPQGTNAYRIQNMLTGLYVSFEQEDVFTDNYGVKLFKYITVEEPAIGNPLLNGAGWFTFSKVTPGRTSLGFLYRINCVEPEGFNMVTALNWEGRSFEKYEHYWFSADQNNPEEVRKPVHPRIVHISNSIDETFYIKANL